MLRKKSTAISACCSTDVITNLPGLASAARSGYSEGIMATVKRGVLTATGEWWTHLRRVKRLFWKAERQAAKKDARREADSGKS